MVRSGFTMIELLVVIVIMGILATVGIYTFDKAQAKARDAQRMHDLRKVQAALQLYYQEQGHYPKQPYNMVPNTSTNWVSDMPSAEFPTVVPFLPNYMTSLPVDPVNKVGNPGACTAYTGACAYGEGNHFYQYWSTGWPGCVSPSYVGQYYILAARMEVPENGNQPVKVGDGNCDWGGGGIFALTNP